jgi:hypothetical protein
MCRILIPHKTRSVPSTPPGFGSLLANANKTTTHFHYRTIRLEPAPQQQSRSDGHQQRKLEAGKAPVTEYCHAICQEFLHSTNEVSVMHHHGQTCTVAASVSVHQIRCSLLSSA